MSIIKVDAGLFRLVHATVSTEETRYYLNGVHIEAHAGGGALLVSTDGHRALVGHDMRGECAETAIVKLPKAALALCKRPKLVERRELVVDVQNSVATINDMMPGKEPDSEPVAEMVASFAVDVIDGTFPDWWRVVPPEMAPSSARPSSFNGDYLKAFGALSAEIGKHYEIGGAAMQLSLTDSMSPAVVRWSGQENLFGILMPMRGDVRSHLPAFMNGRERQ